MDIDALTDDDRKQLAKDLAAELDTGLYGNRAVLSRRQLLTLAGGSAGVAGLVALGVDPATAQSAAGQVGTQSSPEDVFAFDLDVQNGAEFNGSDVTGVGSLSTENANIGDTAESNKFYIKGNAAAYQLADAGVNPGVAPGEAKIYLVDTGSGFELKVGFGNGSEVVLADDSS